MSSATPRASRFVCIHGHYYQPPRESAWTDRLGRQPSARPYHDWNDRITAECYAPNGRARILDARDRVARIVNNYARTSFNFGPTLLSWMETEAPDAYANVLAADTESAARFSGHGSAMAQAYNHMIMPLATPRDQRTQVAWGVRDFERRFGRAPAGMWLPEAAVDTSSLEALAEAGIAFTVLSPRQARSVTSPSGVKTAVTEATLDTGRAYRARLPSGRSIALFFYDGAVSQAVAFERLLSDGAGFARRLLGAFRARDGEDEPNLVHIATDGETYGHHHRFGEMALAWATETIGALSDARLTNYAEFLALAPPTWEAEIVERSSWSCAHGVGRWNDDCGCRMRGGSSQTWRAPLRSALDALRAELDALFEERGPSVLRDPWAARDAYIDVVLDRGDASRAKFLERHGAGALDADGARTAFTLLEAQRFGMLMYTSCGWFFDDLHGIETLQIMEYAVRAAELAGEIDGRDRLDLLLRGLERARSGPNDPTGRDLLRRRLDEARATDARIAAHAALSFLFGPDFPSFDSRVHDVSLGATDHADRGSFGCAAGRVVVEHRSTGRAEAQWFATVRARATSVLPIEPFAVAVFAGADAEARARTASAEARRANDFTEARAALARSDGELFESLGALLPDAQAGFIELRVRAVADDVRARFRAIHAQCEPALLQIAPLAMDPPKILVAASKLVLGDDIQFALESDRPDFAALAALVKTANAEDVHLDRAGLAHAASKMVARVARSLEGDEDSAAALVSALEIAFAISKTVDVRVAEDIVWERLRASGPMNAATRAAVKLLRLAPENLPPDDVPLG
ncbi:MAG: DUF3536 domain-containing protein [Polyangiaceae bacterium]